MEMEVEGGRRGGEGEGEGRGGSTAGFPGRLDCVLILASGTELWYFTLYGGGKAAVLGHGTGGRVA
eukprot:327092-Rhodomonas_salina.1